MKFRYFASLLTIAAGLTGFSEAALADVVVKWQPGDNSANIQKAIDSGDKTIIIPNTGKHWGIGDSIYIKKPNQKIVFKPGVVLLAQKGAFKHKFRSMIVVQANNITLSGYKAQLVMRKQDYVNPKMYEKSEWRHLINVRGAKNFLIEGLTLKNSGGDGIQLTHGLRGTKPIPAPIDRYSSGKIRDVKAINNHRQGISVVSGKNVLIENSIFKETGGTEPASGVDLEPDHDWQKLVNIRFNNTYYLNNQRNGIKVALWHYHGPQVEDVSITFDRCKSVGNGRHGIDIEGVDDGMYNGPKGNITFKNCNIVKSGEHGVFIRNDQVDPSKTFRINFENVELNYNGQKSAEFYPINLHNTHEAGGIPNINFGNNLIVRDELARPPLFATYYTRVHGLTNVHGNIRVAAPHLKKVDLGKNLKNVTLKFNRYTK